MRHRLCLLKFLKSFNNLDAKFENNTVVGVEIKSTIIFRNAAQPRLQATRLAPAGTGGENPNYRIR